MKHFMSISEYCNGFVGILIILFLCMHYPAHSSAYVSIPDSLPLQVMDTARIRMDISCIRNSTGIFEDIGVTPVEFAPFSGLVLNDDNYVDFLVLNGLLYGLASSKVNDSTIPSNVTTIMSNRYHTGVNPVGIVAYRYSRTKSYALAQHLIEEENGYYCDPIPIPGVNLESPYEDEYVVAFSPYMNIVGNQVTYSFHQSMLYTNLPIASISFDPGDGQYHLINMNGSGNYIKNYSQGTETVEIKLKIILADNNNTELYAHSQIALVPPSSSSSSSGGSTYHTEVIECSEPYGLYSPRARITVQYLSGTSLTRPLIVAEGFDPFYNISEVNNQNVPGLGYNTIETFKDSFAFWNTPTYDVVYIDWLDSDAPIQANANLLMDILDWVEDHKSGSEKSILVGQSMGGLIARYALRKLELAGTPHNVKAYISHDSPHYGVNVPIGFVYMAQKILDVAHYWSPLISDIVYVVSLFKDSNHALDNANKYSQLVWLRNAPSVKQMLMNYVNSNNSYDSSSYEDLQNELDTLGFPKGDNGSDIVNLALTNGGVNSFSSGLDSLFFVDVWAYPGLLLPILTSVYSCLTGDIFPTVLASVFVGIGPRVYIKVSPYYSGSYEVFRMWISIIKQWGLFSNEMSEFKLFEDWYNTPFITNVYENDYGSYYKIPNSITEYNTNQHAGNYFVGEYNNDFFINDRFMFVPTVSSLAYKNHYYSITPADRIIDLRTVGVDINSIPFDGYKFVKDTSSYHTINVNDDFKWIDRMLGLSIQSSPDTLLTGYQFHLSGLSALSPEPYTVTWSVADASVAQINSNGIITSVFGGTTEAYADITYLGGHYRLKRQFTLAEIPFPGFPDYVLHQNAAPVFVEGDFSGDYSIYAQSSAQMSSTFTPYMQIHWGVKQNTGDAIQWTTTPYNFFHNYSEIFSCNFPSTATARRVYFYVTFRNQTSLTYSVFCREPVSLVLLDGEGNLYTEDMDEPFVQVKSDGGEYYHFTCLGKNLVYNHWPTWAEFCQDMLTEESFVNMVKTAKPWGTEDLVLIPYSYYTDSDNDLEYGYLTVKYDSTL